jgi:hypothetical protein
VFKKSQAVSLMFLKSESGKTSLGQSGKYLPFYSKKWQGLADELMLL